MTIFESDTNVDQTMIPHAQQEKEWHSKNEDTVWKKVLTLILQHGGRLAEWFDHYPHPQHSTKIQFTRSLRRWTSNAFFLKLLAKENLIIRAESASKRRFSRLETLLSDTISFSIVLLPGFDGSTVENIWERDQRTEIAMTTMRSWWKTNKRHRHKSMERDILSTKIISNMNETHISSFCHVFVCSVRLEKIHR